MISRAKLETKFNEEVERFVNLHPQSLALAGRAAKHMLGGVPMSWMRKWPGGFPVFVTSASGSHFECADGLSYVDFCLGDTGAMAGHSPKETVSSISSQLSNGFTFMLPTADAIAVSENLAARFGLPYWQFTLTATDANRHAIRYARAITGRKKIAVHDYCYHGTVDETFATLSDSGETITRKGNIGAPVDAAETTKVVEFNDLVGLENAFASGDIAAFLIEPALTNIGIVLPQDGYLEGVRALCNKYGVILIVDETHTFSAGMNGLSGRLGLTADILVIGKTIAGGIPAGAFGLSAELENKIINLIDLEDIDVAGIGGTLAGNALSMSAMRATLEEVFTEDNFAHMTKMATLWTAGVQRVIDKYSLPWQVSQLGCRSEYSFREEAPKTGAEAAAADDFEIQQYLHLYTLNRGILMTPFHNMALMSPQTTIADIELHDRVFEDSIVQILA